MSESTATSGSSSYGQGGIKAHFILVVLFIIYISDYADRYLTASMAEFIKKDLNVSDSEIGMLMSVVLLAITVFSLPASIVIDKWSRRKTIAIMVFMWSLACLACRYTETFMGLLIARMFLGIGEAGYAPAGTAMLAAAYPEEKRARMMGIWNISIPVGIAVGLMGGGLVAQRLGWREAFGIMAYPGFVLAVIAWFLPDYRTVKSETAPTVRAWAAEFWTNSMTLLKSRALLFTYLGFAMNVACTTAVASWLPSYFERTGLADPGEGGKLTMPVMALVLIGAPAGGFLADYMRKKRKDARLLIPAVTSTVAAVFLFLAFLTGGTIAVLPLLVLYGISVTIFIAPAAASTQDLAHPGLRALSYALCVIIQHLAGDVWSPTIVGALSDVITLPKAMMFIPMWGLLAGLFFYLGSKHYEADLEKVGHVALEAE